MPDDTSVVSKDCKKLGYNRDGHSYLNQWGNRGKHRKSHRLYKRVLNRPDGYTISFSDADFYCDDHKKNNLNAGDLWVLYVR